jgi:hypothetical protein
MLKPLEQFICDTCGQLIEEPGHGWVEWETERIEEEARSHAHNFRIVHHYLHSPYKDTNKDGCYVSKTPSLHLQDFLGDRGIVQQLSMIDEGPIFYPEAAQPRIKDIREWAELFRRTHICYYEEARQYFSDAKSDRYFDGLNQIAVYSENVLIDIINKYSNK